MGFFYASQKNEKKKSSSRSKTLDPEFLKKAGCKACKRNRSSKYYSPKMEPSGSSTPLVYILGACPSIVDDDVDDHFSDKAGKLLRKHFPKAWDRKNYLRFNYCLNCGASDEKEASSAELDCCRDRIEEDIAQTKPEIIVGIGEIPLKWMLGAHAIWRWSGRRIPVKIKDHTCWFFPVYAPEEIIRKQRFTRGGKHIPNEYDLLYKHDVGNIVKFIDNKNLPEAIVEPEENYFKNVELITGSRGVADLQKIDKILLKLAKNSRSALDYETTQLRPYYKDSKILCVAIGTYEYTVAFPLDHPDGWKSPRFKKQAHELVKRFYNTCGRVTCHNVKFEQEWTEVFYGKGTIKKVVWDDTMAQAYCLDNRKGMLNLGVLTHIYLGFNLKQVTKVDATKWWQYTVLELLRYNALDSKYTDLLFYSQEPRVSGSNKLRKVYTHLVRTSTTIALTQIKGLVPNLNKVEEFSKQLLEKELAIKKKIKRLREVRKYEARFGKFNPTSSDQLLVLLKDKDILDLGDKIKKPGKKGAKDKYSTDVDALEKILEDTKLAQYVIDVRNVTKLRSTYVDAVRDQHTYADGLMHPEYNVYFTSTGRLSSNDPNAQNYPKRKDKWVRAVVGVPEGHELVPLDYGQIEARIICCASHDEAFIDALWTGYDIHQEWALKISKRFPKVIGGKKYLDDVSAIKTFRGVIKNSWVFPAFFGASQYSIGNGLGIPEDIMRELFEEFWDTFKGVKAWHTTIQEFYDAHGYVETLTGRRRHGPLTPNECFNTPIQGTAADIVLNAMNVLSDEGYQAVLNVHDDLSFYLPKSQVVENLEEIAEIMCLSPLDDFNFITVPISVEAERGSDWASCKEFKVYDSTMFGHKRSSRRRV